MLSALLKKKKFQEQGQQIVSEEELYKLGRDIRATHTFIVSALTGKNVRSTLLKIVVIMSGMSTVKSCVNIFRELFLYAAELSLQKKRVGGSCLIL